MPKIPREGIDNALGASQKGLGHGKRCFHFNVDVLGLLSVVLVTIFSSLG